MQKTTFIRTADLILDMPVWIGGICLILTLVREQGENRTWWAIGDRYPWWTGLAAEC